LTPSVSLHILVVEDHEASLQALQMSLEDWGHVIYTADSGDAALPILQEHPQIQVMLTDWRLPGMDGIELCQTVRQIEDRYLYIIMMTARNERGDRVRALEAGADGFIDKPLDLQELRSHIAVAERLFDLEAKLGREYSKLKTAHAGLKEESEVRETLVDLGIQLSGQLDRETLLDSILEASKRLTSADLAAFISGPPEFQEMIVRTEMADFSELEEVLRVVPLTLRMAGARFERYSPEIGALLIVPLTAASGEQLGTVFLALEGEARFSDRDERVVAGLAAQAAVALDNARLYRAAVDNERRLQETNNELRDRYHQLESLKAESEATQANLDSVLSGIQEAFFLLDRSYRFVYLNQAAAHMARSEVADMIGRSFWELFPDLVGSGLDAALEAAQLSGQLMRLEEYYASRQRWYEHRVHPSGDGMLSVFTLDITESKAAELAARKMELWLKAIFDQTSGYFAILHPDGRTAQLNQAALKATGLTLQEVLDQPVWEVELWNVDGERERLRASWDRATAGAVVREVASYRYCDGSLRTMHRSLTPILDQVGKIRYILIEGLDITELKRTEEALERARDQALLANRMKSQFLANMSHEIRTPLSGIRGMTEFLTETELNEHQREYVDAISRCSQGLLAIVGDVLDLSRIEAGELEIREETFELRSTVEHLVGLFAYRTREKGVELKLSIEESVPDIVLGDPDRLRQILTNLVNNSVKFTDQGSIEVRVATGSRVQHSVLFEVVDTGIGIHDDSKSKLFQPFSQVDSSPSRRYGGTGLGLSIVKRLVELMKGEVGFESNYEAGSTFWFELPLVPSTRELLPEPRQLRTGGGRDLAALGDLRVLVAEDNEVSRRVALLQLEKLGVQAHAVTNGEEVLEILRREPFDLILMDCQMPQLDGYSAAAKIRAEGFDGHNDVVIIALTAHALKGEREKCLAAGMDDYTIKPLAIESLRGLLSHWAEVRRDRLARA
jgi:PAS domain S-box-containing protein